MRAGDRHASRVGVSLLENVGLRECISYDDAQFAAICAALARDAAHLRTLREGMRERVRVSNLTDANAYRAHFTSAMRMIWRERCAQA
jgi:predicted O-linked N-acetylglucosamine transferase (SPINDLY family)